MKRMAADELSDEFTIQTENLIRKGYHRAMGIDEEAFRQLLEPLRERAQTLTVQERNDEDGKLPFVIVIQSSAIPVKTMMERTERDGASGFVDLHPIPAEKFRPISEVTLPRNDAYILADIHRGKETLNVRPSDAYVSIDKSNRSPLTIDEGIAIITHYPQFLKKNNCFSLLASRCEDKRVPAIWISDKKPRLGWCWEGNPHTWLGSASAKERIG